MGHLFGGPQPMLAFMWQDDLIGVAKYVNVRIANKHSGSSI